ncbi:MAG: nucleotidyltransferase family protein [bacterium]
MEQLLINNKEKLEDFCRKNQIKLFALFGSFARGEEREDSDIDIMIDFTEAKSLMKIGGIQYDLEESLGRSVDLVSMKNIKPALKNNILKDLKVLYVKR